MDEETDSPRRRRPGGPVIAMAAAGLTAATALTGWAAWQQDGGATAAAQPDPRAPHSEEPGGGPSAAPGSGAPSPGRGREPLAGRTVVVDPGHNPGNVRHTAEINQLVDVGTHRKECDTTGTATDDGYPEAAFTRDVSQRLRTLLEKQGAVVEFTHDNDRAFGPCVDERAHIGNKARADAVISVHADGAAPGERGFHLILPGPVRAGAADTSKIIGPSRRLGERVAAAFRDATGSAPARYAGGGTGLDVRTDLGGLNLSTVPKVFVECGNMRNARDADLLSSPRWRQRAAEGIANGLRDFLTTKPERQPGR